MNATTNTKFEINSNYESIKEADVFPRVLKVLMAYATKLIGDSTMRLAKNRADLAYDFSMEAIKRYLEEPDKFVPAKNPDLISYLKFYILRQLISNHKNREGQKNEVLYENYDSIGITVQNSSIDFFNIDDSIDLKDLINNIRSTLDCDIELLKVFDLRYVMDYKPAEIMNELSITSREYNNRIRRIDTIRRNILNSLELTN